MRAMSDQEAIAAFLRSRQPTKCPTAYALPSKGMISDDDRGRIRDYHAARDMAMTQRMSRRQMPVAR